MSFDNLFQPLAFARGLCPVAPEHLLEEGLSPKFVDYMWTFKGFVAEAVAAE